MDRKLSILLLVIVASALVVALLRHAGTMGSDVQPTAPRVQTSPNGTTQRDLVSAPGEPASRREPGVDTVASSTLAHLVVHAIGKADRQPLAGIRASLRRSGSETAAVQEPEAAIDIEGSLQRSPITDLRGLVRFDLPARTEVHLRLDTEIGNSATAEADVPALSEGETRDLTFELGTSKSVHFFGRAVRSEDHIPIAGAIVEVEVTRSTYWDKQEGPRVPGLKRVVLNRYTTGVDGRFELRVQGPEGLNVWVRTPGRSIALVDPQPGHETRDKALDVTLCRSATLLARITDAQGDPVRTSSVRLSTGSLNLSVYGTGMQMLIPSRDTLHWSASGDSDGVCRFGELPASAPLRVELYEGDQPARKDLDLVTLTPGESREVEWRIGAGCTLRGWVTDQRGEKVTDQTIWLLRAESEEATLLEPQAERMVVIQTDTDIEGRFEFADLGPGRWWVGPAAESYAIDLVRPSAIAPLAQVVEIQAGVHAQELRLQVQRGLYIRGEVIGPTGTAAPGVPVIGHAASAAWTVKGTSDEDGSFALGPLVPGRYQLVTLASSSTNAEPIEADAGQEGLVLQLRAGGLLRGTAVEAATGKACRAWISCVSDGSTRIAGWTNSKSDGAFEIGDLEPGIYDVMARTEDGNVGLLRHIVVAPRLDTDGLQLMLSPGGRLRMRNAAEKGWVVYTVERDGVRFAEGLVRAGRIEEAVVPSGHHVIKLTWSSKSSDTKEIDITAGEEKEVVFGGK